MRFFEPEVARVFISPLPEEVVIGTPNFVTCRCKRAKKYEYEYEYKYIQIQIDKRIYKYTCLPRSDGGNPPPKLEARIEVTGVESRQLIPVSSLYSRTHQNKLLIGKKFTNF